MSKPPLDSISSQSTAAGDQPSFRRIAVLLTCHNRRDLTLECLGRLFSQTGLGDLKIETTLVDDGSSDGTGDAVEAQFPHVTVLRGDGSLYWCGGMRRAWSHAEQSAPDGYLLLNDDTILRPEALGELIRLCESPDSPIIGVASIIDPTTDRVSYGGVLKSLELARPNGSPRECATFNANCVLIPKAVFEKIGMLHSGYSHAMGDTDYGFMARRNGVRIFASGTSLGECTLNLGRGKWRNRTLPRLERLRALQSPKELPWKEWVEFNRRNAGWIWPYRCISPFLRILLGR